MPYVDRIGASIGGRMTSVGEPPGLAAAGAGEFQTVEVPRDVLRVLNKAAITTPPKGQMLDVADVDAKLSAANISTQDRLMAKAVLAEKRLLPLGRRIG